MHRLRIMFCHFHFVFITFAKCLTEFLQVTQNSCPSRTLLPKTVPYMQAPSSVISKNRGRVLQRKAQLSAAFLSKLNCRSQTVFAHLCFHSYLLAFLFCTHYPSTVPCQDVSCHIHTTSAEAGNNSAAAVIISC